MVAPHVVPDLSSVATATGAKRCLPVPVATVQDSTPEDMFDVFDAVSPLFDEEQEWTDLADEFKWNECCGDILREQRTSVWWVPSSYCLRWRDEVGDGRYGKKGIPAHLKDKVRLETLHAVRIAKFLLKLTTLNRSWIAKAPHVSDGMANPFFTRRVDRSVTMTG